MRAFIKNLLSLRFTLVSMTFLVQACANNFTISSESLTGFEPIWSEDSSFVVTSPANSTTVGASVNMTGTCLDTIPIQISIADVGETATATCLNSRFNTTLQLPPSDGVKTILLMQTDKKDETRSTSLSVTKDSTQATVVLSTTVSSSTNVSPIPMTAIFSKSVTGLSNSDIAVTNGTVSGLSGTGKTYAFDVTPSGQGLITIHILAAAVQDSVGNRNLASNSISVTYDSIVPVLAFTSPGNASYVNRSNSAALSVSGTCSKSGPVHLSVGSVSATATCSAGMFLSMLNLQSLSDGTLNLTANMLDSSGNNAVPASLSLIKDTTIPVFTSLATSPASPSSSLTLALTGSVEPNSALKLYKQSSCGGVVVASGTAQSSGSFALSAPSLVTTGSYFSNIYSLLATDTAGNTACSASINYTYDPEPTVTMTSPIASTYANAAAVSGLTFLMSGTCSTSATTVNLTLTDGTHNIAGTAPCSAGTWSTTTINISTLNEGSVTLTSRLTDQFGLIATPVSVSFVKDTSPPALVISSPSNSSNVTSIYSATGTCETGSTISVSGGIRQASTNTTCSSGAFSIDFALLKSAGAHSITISATDSAGNRTDRNLSLNYAGDVTMGVNLATACGDYHAHWGLPGDLNVIAWDFDYYKARGLTVFRLPLTWESLQPTLNGPLTAWQVSCLHSALTLAKARGVKLIFDIHNYGRYVINNNGGTENAFDHPVSDQSLLGSANLPISAFTNLWTRMATEFTADAGLYGYDLMNEPHDMLNSSIWPTAVQAAINAIRPIDHTTAIIVEGDSWSNSQSWPSLNSTFTSLSDPSNNLIFSAHLYFDDTSGNYSGIYDSYSTSNPNIGVTRATPFVNWIKANGYRGYFGEYGAPGNDSRWQTVVQNFLNYITLNGISGTAWSGGYLWGVYGQETAWYNLDPVGAVTMPASPVEKPALTTLKKYPTSL